MIKINCVYFFCFLNVIITTGDLMKKLYQIRFQNHDYEYADTFSVGKYKNSKEIISLEGDYFKAFVNLIEDNFKNVLNESEVKDLIEKNSDEIIDNLLSNQKEKENYRKSKEPDKYKRFFDAKEQYIKESLAKAIEPIVNAIKSIKINNSIIDMQNKVIHTISNALSNILKSIEKIKFTPNTLKKWADYGWTTIGEASIDLFLVEPQSQEEADEICSEFFKGEKIGDFLKEIEKIESAAPYIKESITLFKKKYYRGCSMLVIAAIDRILSENITVVNERRTKQIGIRAVNKIKEAFEKNEEELLTYIFIINNLICFLSNLFEDGNDFKEKIDYVNRNYIMHGWLDDEVTELDCIKLYNALHNLNNNIDYIKEIYNSSK